MHEKYRKHFLRFFEALFYTYCLNRIVTILQLLNSLNYGLISVLTIISRKHSCYKPEVFNQPKPRGSASDLRTWSLQPERFGDDKLIYYGDSALLANSMKYTERPVGVLGVMLSKDELERMAHARYHGGGRHRQRRSEQEFWTRLDSLNRSLDQMETRSDADEGAQEHFPVTLGDSFRVHSAIDRTLNPTPPDDIDRLRSTAGTQAQPLAELVAPLPDAATEEALAKSPLPIPEDAWITELRAAAHTLHTMPRPTTAPVRAASPTPTSSKASQTLSPTQLQVARVSKPKPPKRTGADRQPLYFSLEAPATGVYDIEPILYKSTLSIVTQPNECWTMYSTSTVEQ